MQKEEAFVYPPLTLLPALADGKVSADMKWAIPMADRVKSERAQLFKEHTELTGALNELIAAAKRGQDRGVVFFAQEIASESLNEVEVLEPAAILVGDYLRAKLPGG